MNNAMTPSSSRLLNVNTVLTPTPAPGAPPVICPFPEVEDEMDEETSGCWNCPALGSSSDIIYAAGVSVKLPPPIIS